MVCYQHDSWLLLLARPADVQYDVTDVVISIDEPLTHKGKGKGTCNSRKPSRGLTARVIVQIAQ